MYVVGVVMFLFFVIDLCNYVQVIGIVQFVVCYQVWFYDVCCVEVFVFGWVEYVGYFCSLGIVCVYVVEDGVVDDV